jgi:hypothetical protein
LSCKKKEEDKIALVWMSKETPTSEKLTEAHSGLF